MVLDKIDGSLADDPLPRGFLVGRRALVTGAARRLGRAMALGLARQGAEVVIHYRTSHDEASRVVEEIVDLGGRAWSCAADLADPEAAADLVDAAARCAGGALDILINNASIFAQGEAETTTAEAWDTHQAVNLRAPWLLSQGLARQIPSDGRGDIINLNDIRALRPGPDHFAYTLSKVGLHGLTCSLALALAPRIRVNELALGAVLPPEGASESYVHTLREQIPVGTFSSPDEVVRAVLFLLAGGTTTGQTLFIDGGQHLT